MGFNNIEIDQWFERRRSEGSRPTRSNTTVNNGIATERPDILYRGKANLEIRNNFFTMRVVRSWNELPDDVKNQTSVNGFKNAYDRWKKRSGNESQQQQQQQQQQEQQQQQQRQQILHDNDNNNPTTTV